MTVKKLTTEHGGEGRKRISLKIAAVEYRVQWNEAAHAWDVVRNGVATGVSARKKRKSAVDSAIRDAKTEFETSKATVVVTCLRDRKLETVWKGL